MAPPYSVTESVTLAIVIYIDTTALFFKDGFLVVKDTWIKSKIEDEKCVVYYPPKGKKN